MTFIHITPVISIARLKPLYVIPESKIPAQIAILLPMFCLEDCEVHSYVWTLHSIHTLNIDPFQDTSFTIASCPHDKQCVNKLFS